MEENANFHCIVCKAEFLSRTERNEHLETHFVHRSCKHCSRPVIIIGDLEFELHHPTYCKTIETMPGDNFEGDYSIYENSQQNDIYKYEVEEEQIEAEEEADVEEEGEEESDVESLRKTKRNQTKVDYNEEANEVLSILKPRKERPTRKAKQKSIKRSTKSERNTVKIESNSNNVKADSEDDVIKEMDAMKKRRKQYAKLPKTVPCTMCDAMFGTERTLKIHMNQVHGIKERYICPICSREFKISGNLKQHIETHSDYKRFICNYCGKGFHLPYNLKEHMHTHTGARYEFFMIVKLLSVFIQ